TGAVVVSVDYAKAPEYPYPYAIDQCYEVYREIVQTDGRCLGLEPDGRPLRIVLAGDSAGGNITASVMFRILESADNVQLPEGIVFIYGCFNVDIRAWMTKDETRALLGASGHVLPDSTCLHKSLSSLVDTRDHLSHISPLAVTNRDDGYQQQQTPHARGKHPLFLEDRVRVVRKPAHDGSNSGSGESGGDSGAEDTRGGGLKPFPKPASPANDMSDSTVSDERRTGYLPLTMTSSFTYFNDQILSPEMMRAMIIMYVGPTGRPNFRTDYYLSPLVAPDHLLARFPPVYFMCGEKDPMVDDTVLFAARIRNAKQRAAEKDSRRTTAAGNNKPRRTKSKHLVPGLAGSLGEYRDYKSSRLYSRRHSQPKPYTASTRFYIGSTDVSDDENHSGTAASGNKAGLPASLRMSQFPPSGNNSDNAGHTDRKSLGNTAIIKVKLVAGMSHGFMQMYSLLPESKRVANILGDWLSEMLYGSHTITPFSRCASMVNVPDSTPTAAGYASQTDDDDDSNRSGNTSAADGQSRWAVDASVAGQLKRGRRVPSRVSTPNPSLFTNELTVQMQSPPCDNRTSLSPTGRSIFDGGFVDKHGIEVVSAANMVRRRGYGLADPLN
ncbi:hypothetical protein LPJ61_005259, partial [Coemansia biformis]